MESVWVVTFHCLFIFFAEKRSMKKLESMSGSNHGSGIFPYVFGIDFSYLFIHLHLMSEV